MTRRPTMEEIGYRTNIFGLDGTGVAGSQRDYIHWLLRASSGNKAESHDRRSENGLRASVNGLPRKTAKQPALTVMHISGSIDSNPNRSAKPACRKLATQRFFWPPKPRVVDSIPASRTNKFNELPVSYPIAILAPMARASAALPGFLPAHRPVLFWCCLELLGA